MMLHQEMARLAQGLMSDPVPGAPEVDVTLAPASGEDAAPVLALAAEHSLVVLQTWLFVALDRLRIVWRGLVVK